MLPFIVSLAIFMESLDATIINTAIPVMSVSLDVSPIDLKIALISYLLSLAIFIPISGWLGDKFGIKRTFITALFIFTLSSIFCGNANSLLGLVIARLFQGLGGSLMLPLGRLLIIRHYEKHELIRVMGQVIIIASLGIMLGPLLGGIISEHTSWRWIFYVNIPFGLLNILLAYRYLPYDPPKIMHRLDKLGFFLFGSGLALLTFGLSALSESNIAPSKALLIILCSSFFLIYYIVHSKKQMHPIVNTQLFHYRTFRIATLGNLFARLSFGGAPFLIPLLLQVGLGYSPQTSGFLLAPTALGVLAAKPFSLRILQLLGYKKLLIVNTTLLSIVLCAFIIINDKTSYLMIATLTFLYGFLIALQYSGMNSIAYSEIKQDEYSAATSIMSTLQQLAQSFGVAVCAILLEFFSSMLSQPSSITVPIVHNTFIVMGVLTFASVIIFSYLKPHDGNELLAPKNTVSL